MIQIFDVSKRYRSGKTFFDALTNTSLLIERGEFVAIVGPSGSGKSTLLHLMGGLDRPTSGAVIVNGNNLGTMSDRALAKFRNETIGFVFQSFYLLPNTSALENVVLPLMYTQGVPKRRRRAQEALMAVGLGSKLRNRPSELSGGEQQRVAIARALVNDPDIILADEPTGNLDSATGQQIIGILLKLHELGKTLILVTHDHSLARVAGRIIRIEDGQII